MNRTHLIGRLTAPQQRSGGPVRITRPKGGRATTITLNGKKLKVLYSPALRQAPDRTVGTLRVVC
jgi:hypothetical protein